MITDKSTISSDSPIEIRIPCKGISKKNWKRLFRRDSRLRPMSEQQAPFPSIESFGLKIHCATMPETLLWMENCIADQKPRFLCTLNAALIVWAQKDSSMMAMYNQADFALADSVVIYYALKLLGKPVPEPLEACQIMFQFIKKNCQKNYRYYFL